jgi:DNA replication regulator DPB11
VKWALDEHKTREAAIRAGKKVGEEIKIVYEAWIWDCVAFEGRWKEDYYDAKKPRRAGRVRAGM